MIESPERPARGGLSRYPIRCTLHGVCSLVPGRVLLACLAWIGCTGPLCAQFYCTLQQTNNPLVDFNSVWRFHPNSNDLAAAITADWMLPEFDDSGWLSGQGLFGFESTVGKYDWFGPFRTYIDPPSLGSQPVSTYFRTHFQWHDSRGRPNGHLNFTNAVDDGIVVYLNGVEIFSISAPATPRPLPWNTLSPVADTSLYEGVALHTNLVVDNLREGDNLLAVVLLQNSLLSSDDVFAMKLTGWVDLGDPYFSDQPTNQVVPADQVAVLVAEPPPASSATFQWFEYNPIPGATNAILRVTNSCGILWGLRAYYCRITTELCDIPTRTALVNFLQDLDSAQLLFVRSTSSQTNVLGEFTKRMDPATASDPFNYQLEDTEGHAYPPFRAELQADERTVSLSFTNLLQEGAPYTLRIPEGGISDVCGIGILPISVLFYAWSLTVSLHETHLPGSLLRLEWNDSSMILENAPTPSGPWTALPLFASGQNINISSTGCFFRLKRLPE